MLVCLLGRDIFVQDQSCWVVQHFPLIIRALRKEGSGMSGGGVINKIDYKVTKGGKEGAALQQKIQKKE